VIDDATLSRRARSLAAHLEPCVGQVYFSPECHAEYERLGFSPSRGEVGGVALPDGVAYFTSRGSILGQVAPHVVAATFAVFNPEVVVPCVQMGWALTDAPTIFAARRRGAVAQLARVLGARPDGVERAVELLERAVAPLNVEGRSLFAGLRSQWDDPSDPLTRFFHLGDELREYRGDSHTAAWISAGLDATEIGLLTELFLGLPLRSYVRSRVWSDEQLDAALERLTARGWVADGAFTPAGHAAREEIEANTDRQLRPAIAALADDFDGLIALIGPWGDAVRDAGGYLRSPDQLAPRQP
jgi:Helix-turn-helix family